MQTVFATLQDEMLLKNLFCKENFYNRSGRGGTLRKPTLTKEIRVLPLNE